MDARVAVSPCLRRIGWTQRGYGLHVPGPPLPRNRRAEEHDGLCVCARARACGGREGRFARCEKNRERVQQLALHTSLCILWIIVPGAPLCVLPTVLSL